jgi:hypothetical protein
MSNYNYQKLIYPHGIYDNWNNNCVDFSKESTENGSIQHFDSESRFNRNCQCECHQRCLCECCSKNFYNLIEELNEVRSNYKNVMNDLNKLKSDKISTDTYINELILENKRLKFNNSNVNVGEENEKLKYDNGRFKEMLNQLFDEVLKPLSNKITFEEGKLKGGVDYYFDKNYEFYKILNLFKKLILDNKNINNNKNDNNCSMNIIEKEKWENLDNQNNNNNNNHTNQYKIPYNNQNISNNKPLTFGNNEPNSSREQNSPFYNVSNNKINYQCPYINGKHHMEKDNSLINSINSQGLNMNEKYDYNNPNFHYSQYMNNKMHYQDSNSLMNSINSQNSFNNNINNELKNSANLKSNFNNPRNLHNQYYPNNSNINNYMNNNKGNINQKLNKYNNEQIKAIIKNIDSFPNNINYQKYGKQIDTINQEKQNKNKKPISPNKEEKDYFYPKNQISKNQNLPNNNNNINNNNYNFNHYILYNNKNELKRSNSVSNFNSDLPFNQTFKEENLNKTKNQNQKTEKMKNYLNNILKKTTKSFQKKNISITEKEKEKKVFNPENTLFYNPDPFTVHLKLKVNKQKNLSSRKENKDNNSNYLPDGNCFACDLGCSVSSSGYSPMTYSPYKNQIKRRDVTPMKNNVKNEE